MRTDHRHLVVLTGAGISADSGVDTYRDAGGLWEGHSFEDVATPEAWRRDRALVWRFYQARRAALASVEPNAAHLALVELERALVERGDRFTLVTQNVDDLHQRAGSTPIAMHGELARLRCEGCGLCFRELETTDAETYVACPACGAAPARPDVVWFGEVPYGLADIERALSSATTFIAIGTSGAVYPAAAYLAYARAAGIRTVVQGLEAPDNLAAGDEFRAGRARVVIPEIVAELLRGAG